ncbi:hypothetical protein HY498_02965 [Candidatus Woesearchaeota archaeon]|nr:hypothetical protein [Candidatus Woesearchaeota archaeon]
MALGKKGAELSLNFIIIAAIGLVVLVIALVFFTGGAERLLGGVPETIQVSQQQLNLWRNQCQAFCSLDDKSNYCNAFYWIDRDKDKKYSSEDEIYKCSSVSNKPGKLTKELDLGVSCVTITKCT